MSYLTEKSMIVVPYWVMQAIKKAKMPIDRCLCYSTLSTLMSKEDIAVYLSMQTQGTLANLLSPSFSTLVAHFRKNTPSEEIPIIHSLIADAQTVKTEESATERLQVVDKTYEHAWEIQDLSREVFAVVVYPGILDQLKDRQAQLDIIRQVLKIFYGHFPVWQVSGFSIFARYLSALEYA